MVSLPCLKFNSFFVICLFSEHMDIDPKDTSPSDATPSDKAPAPVIGPEIEREEKERNSGRLP